MAYNILYIEDLTPDTIVSEFQNYGVSVTHHDPNSFDEVLDVIQGEYDAIVLDFRLTSKKARFDAPVIASSIRTTGTKTHVDIPVILISNEENIAGFYQDFTSQDQFDFAVTKEKFRKDAKSYVKQIQGFINAYKEVINVNFDERSILGLSVDKFGELDFRIKEYLSHKEIKNDVFATVRFINLEVIQPSGVLVNEDVLAARLGVLKESANWNQLLQIFDEAKYSGVLSDIYPRWWMKDILHIWSSYGDNRMSLKRLTSDQRVTYIKENIKINNVIPAEKPKYSVSSRLWYTCLISNQPLDSIDGLELYRRELYPWQDNEFVCFEVGLDPTNFENGKHILKHLQPFSREKLKSKGESLNS